MTPQEEIQVRQMMALQNAARSRGLLGNTPDPTTNYRPPYSREEIERLMRDEEAQRLAPRAPSETMAEYYRRMGINPGRPTDGSPPSFSPNTRYNPDGTPIPPMGGEVAADPEPEEYDGFVNSGTGQRGYLDFKYMPSPPPVGGGVAADPEPEEYDGFVNSGTGQRGYLDFKYMPTPMAQAAPPVANTAYNAPPVANTAYMPPPTDAPVNTAYMPSRRTVPVDTTYRPPASANTTYMPSPSPTYGMSTTPTYNMSNAQTTTPSYGGQIREPSYSPNQAGKYKVDSPRLKNTGGLFNDLNAFFGRPQT